MIKNEPSVKILVGYHKPAVLLKDDILTPIHLGRAIATENSKDGKISEEDYKWMLDNMIGDDTGDNISNLNRQFCEMTGIYWAWKNYDKLGNPDYIGFMHYRRHFIFKDENIDHVNTDVVLFDEIDEEYLNTVNMKPDNIQKLIKGYDIIEYAPLLHPKTVFDQFADLSNPNYNLDFDVWEKSTEILKKSNPDYADAANLYLNQNKHIWFNVFIMKRELFFKYAEWIFKLLFELNKQIDLNLKSVKGKRVLAFIVERFFGIFLTKHSSELKARKLKLTLIKDPDIRKDIEPAFSSNNIPVVMSSDNNYVYYLAASIKSLILNSGPDRNYDIMILTDNITIENQRLLKTLALPNVSIRFIDVKPYLKKIDPKIFYITGPFTQSTYYRFLISTIFNKFDKILYLDCDSIILDDVSKLYDTKIGSNLLAACIDVGMIANFTANKTSFNFIRDKLAVTDPYKYFQAGVMVVNIHQFKQQNIQDKLFKKLSEIKTPPFVDQDILNAVCYNQVTFLDPKWNVEWNLPIDFSYYENCLPESIYDQYIINRNNPSFLHYSGRKPWNLVHQDLAEIFWEYASQTPFFVRTLIETITAPKNNTYFSTLHIQGQNVPIQAAFKMLWNYRRYKFKLWKYKFLSKLTWNKTRKKYKRKYKDLKRKVATINQIFSQL